MGAKIGGPGGGSRYNIGQNSDINVTPFVDVMLVLLIIFMVSAPLATVSIKLDMPPAVPPRADQPKPEPPVFISIQGENELYLGKGEEAPVPTSLDTLVNDLGGRGIRPSPSEDRVFVRANAEVLYNQFMEVLNTLQDNGYYTIGLINEDIS
jgi:biopolymer transport protein ExbD